jgi:hypothetical protein
MKPLPVNSSDKDLIAHIDGWATLLEQENYREALEFVDHDESWTADLLRKVIKSYGNASPTQRATRDGKPTDIAQRKEVTRWTNPRPKGIGEVWYDLNIDELASDLTAIFRIVPVENGIILYLESIHVM